MIAPGVEVELLVEKPVAGGQMLARHGGRVVLVSGAIPGERVLARVERIARGVAHADTVDVLDADPDRRRPPFDPACGGHDYAHIAPARQCALKVAILVDAMERLGRIALDGEPRISASSEAGYRLRTRLHVGRGRIGFYRRGSHEICDPREVPSLGAGVQSRIGTASTDLDREIRDGLREIHVAENLDGTQQAWHFTVGRRGLEPVLRQLVERLDLTGASISWSSAERGTPLAGEPCVADALADLGMTGVDTSIALRRHPLAFFQANRYLMSTLVQRVTAAVAGGRVLDLYAGVGLFAVALAAKGLAVTAVEGDRVALVDLEANARSAGDAVRCVGASVERHLASRAGGFDTIVLDPPRTGLTRDALAGVCAAGARRLVYVSCDPPTLARDAARFLQQGYRLSALEALDLFPNTSHVEAICVLDRAS